MTQALYRRYRPETFDEVIGQDHVTEPLKAALASGRVTHAYLFSGPRGCGKTTSARIFARCLNCAEGPTETPCGTCDSCVELARDGSGSLDVVEIDAASHNGVDDARELRERAAYAPARDRFKIFILDEAHMVTPQGFNALLKIVEEPPEHVKFIFATTEPDKVIGTIRSRTHHYPFRLVPPGVLGDYLAELSAEEGVSAESGVLPMVVRAGGGSVRDSLSVLDQLIAGTSGGEISYDDAAALLGFTSASLLDDAVEALAGRDGAALFQVVDRVVGSGHDPRRFVEDLLQRLRDLVILAIAGESGESALGSLPQDQVERMRAQASHLGAPLASRAADLTNQALFEMSGATSPRLQLELLCARLLLPAAEAEGGLGTRVAALENAMSRGAGIQRAAAGAPGAAGERVPERGARDTEPGPRDAAASARAAAAALRDVEEPAAEPVVAPDAGEPEPRMPDAAQPEPNAERQAREESSAEGRSNAAGQDDAEPAREATEEPAREATEEPAQESAQAPVRGGAKEAGQPDSTLVRRRWGEVLETLGRIRRASWVLVSQSAAVGELRDGTLHLIFETPGLVQTFQNGGHHENVSLALRETLGMQVAVRGVHGDEGGEPREQQPSGDFPGGGRGPGDHSPSDHGRRSSYGAGGQDHRGGRPQGGGDDEDRGGDRGHDGDGTGTGRSRADVTPPEDHVPTSADDLLAAVERASAHRRDATAAGHGIGRRTGAPHRAMPPAGGGPAYGAGAGAGQGEEFTETPASPQTPASAGSAAEAGGPASAGSAASAGSSAEVGGPASAAGPTVRSVGEPAGVRQSGAAAPDTDSPFDDMPSPDDATLDGSDQVGIRVLEQVLGARRVGDDGR